MDLGVTTVGLITGVLVGLTGMGGGALTMPLLTLVFGVPPLAAVSTDLVANAITKPVGAVVHLGRKTVNLRLVGLLCVGSLPCAAAGAWLDSLIGTGEGAHQLLKVLTGIAVLLAAITLFIRMYLDNVRAQRAGAPAEDRVAAPAGRTVLLGAFAGLIVGMTSVGSGSIVIVCLLLLERRLTSAQLVGTDLVQAVPLVIVAAASHLLVGDVDFGLVGALLLGSVPGVLVGSLFSSMTPDRPIRVLLGVMLVTTGLMLVGTPVTIAAAVAAVLTIGGFGWLRADQERPAEASPVHVGNEGGRE